MMNLYVRYFDHDTLATNIQEVVAFLSSIDEIKYDANAIDRIINFAESDNTYPFRLKVSYSNYVLFLKTEAKTLEEFKYMEKMRKQQGDNHSAMAERKRTQMDLFNEQHEGWYEASLIFKRVVTNPDTGKCQYVDTRFRVRLKADSAMHCYNRMIEHLRNRQDVDVRSQFPSIKSNNFTYTFLGNEQQEESPVPDTDAADNTPAPSDELSE